MEIKVTYPSPQHYAMFLCLSHAELMHLSILVSGPVEVPFSVCHASLVVVQPEEPSNRSTARASGPVEPNRFCILATRIIRVEFAFLDLLVHFTFGKLLASKNPLLGKALVFSVQLLL